MLQGGLERVQHARERQSAQADHHRQGSAEPVVMSSPNFATTFSVEKRPEEAFNAIKNVREWWSQEIEKTRASGGHDDQFRDRQEGRQDGSLFQSPWPGSRI